MSEGVSHTREQVTGTGGAQYLRCIRAFRAAELVQVGAAELPQVRWSCKSQKVNFCHPVPQCDRVCGCPVVRLASVQSLCGAGTEGVEKGSSEVGQEWERKLHKCDLRELG